MGQDGNLTIVLDTAAPRLKAWFCRRRSEHVCLIFHFAANHVGLYDTGMSAVTSLRKMILGGAVVTRNHDLVRLIYGRSIGASLGFIHETVISRTTCCEGSTGQKAEPHDASKQWSRECDHQPFTGVAW